MLGRTARIAQRMVAVAILVTAMATQLAAAAPQDTVYLSATGTKVPPRFLPHAEENTDQDHASGSREARQTSLQGVQAVTAGTLYFPKGASASDMSLFLITKQETQPFASNLRLLL